MTCEVCKKVLRDPVLLRPIPCECGSDDERD
jgi:hypothetical protein